MGRSLASQEVCRATKRRWHEENREKEYTRAREYYRENTEKVKAGIEKVKTRNRAIIQEAKQDMPCADCGLVFHPAAMDFDHVRGVKYKGLSKMLSCSVEQLQAEIAKCDVRCANCHRTRHAVKGGDVQAVVTR